MELAYCMCEKNCILRFLFVCLFVCLFVFLGAFFISYSPNLDLVSIQYDDMGIKMSDSKTTPSQCLKADAIFQVEGEVLNCAMT